MSIKLSAGIAAAILFFAAAPAFAQTPPNAGVGAGTSANWAGYVATGSTYTGVGGTWTIPTPSVSTSTRVAADATWVGIGGVSSKDLIQAGTQAIVQNGAVTYQAWYETLPQYQQQVPVTVHGGDSVTVSLNETSTNNWQLSFNDNTTGQQYQTTISYTSSHSSADWIEEMPIGGTGRVNGYLPLDSFGTAQFTNGYAVVNGSQETLAALGAQPLTMVAGGGQALATPSALGSDSASFSVARSSVSASSQYAQGGKGWRRTGVGIQSFTPGQRNSRSSSRIVIPLSFSRFGNGIRMEFMLWR
jgi:hypothetical protein